MRMTPRNTITDYAKKIGVDPGLALGIAGAEGLHAWGPKNPNAGSYVDRTNGQPWSFGDFQLNTRNGMGVDALRAGVDPRDPNQWQAADRFALDQMKARGVGPWKGDPVARAYLASGKTPGTTLTSVPGPDVGTGVGGGQGGVTPQSAQTPPADDGKPKSIWDYLRKAGDAITENKTDKDGKEIPGTSLADKIGSQFDPKPSAGGGAPEMNLGMGGGAQQPDTYGPAAQAFAAQLQQMQQPVWTPPPAGQQGVPGTTLNSLALIKQLYG